ncbi:L,D-transpeptidase [Synechococcus sp. CCY 9618]|uniref:L,D-transpeptidase n=1 Tax=Synechococcus sp. CCY 9618 TaxID=2815602 RepID=UPI001C20FAD4|nr:L,D-transpeptidase [Synechococcus sp. CCY 9618]
MSRPPALFLLLAAAWGATAGTGALAANQPDLQPAPQPDPRPVLQPAAQPAPEAAAPTPAAAVITREIVLELGKRTISLRDNGRVLGSWPVAIGDAATPTPKGRFQVEVKVVNPQYQSTKSGRINPTKGPNGPLGDRWIGFKQSGLNQYGIHGTPSAWAWTVTSRSAVTNGCVRMLTPHVRALFDQVEVGTPVVVKP